MDQIKESEISLVEYFKKRLNISDTEYTNIMSLPPKSFKDFPNYKRLFEKLRPMFYMLYKSNLVPKSFYIKYTSKDDI